VGGQARTERRLSFLGLSVEPKHEGTGSRYRHFRRSGNTFTYPEGSKADKRFQRPQRLMKHTHRPAGFTPNPSYGRMGEVTHREEQSEMTLENTNPSKVFDSVDALETFSLMSEKVREMLRDDARATLLIKDPTATYIDNEMINVIAVTLIQHGWSLDNRFTFSSNEVTA